MWRMEHVELMEYGQMKKANRCSASSFQTGQPNTWKIKVLVMLAYSDLDSSKEMEQKFICNEIR